MRVNAGHSTARRSSATLFLKNKLHKFSITAIHKMTHLGFYKDAKRPTTLSLAIKEWASVCLALACRRQTILVRAGGIHDTQPQFGFKDSVFWLYPTAFHQTAEKLAEKDIHFASEAANQEPLLSARRIDLLGVVEATAWLTDMKRVEQLAPFHILSESVIAERFAYRSPGLAVALVRVWRRKEPHLVEETSEMAGCRSRVELVQQLETDWLECVMPDDAFENVSQAIHSALGQSLELRTQ